MANRTVTIPDSVREKRALERWKPARRWYHRPLTAVVIAMSRFIIARLNTLTIEGIERFDMAQRQRGRRGLLTFSNHVAMFDDPLLPANFTPRRYEQIRWVASDAINFFGSAWKSWLFTAGKCVPIVRGAGVDQPGYHFLRERLLEGEWVHIFPEGGRTRDPDALVSALLKPGIGRLIAETRPLALPFYHYGMHEVLPVGAALPRRGHTVVLRFGNPQVCDDQFVTATAGPDLKSRAAEGERWQLLADWCYRELRRLEVDINPKAEAMHGTAR